MTISAAAVEAGKAFVFEKQRCDSEMLASIIKEGSGSVIGRKNIVTQVFTLEHYINIG